MNKRELLSRILELEEKIEFEDYDSNEEYLAITEELDRLEMLLLANE